MKQCFILKYNTRKPASLKDSKPILILNVLHIETFNKKQPFNLPDHILCGMDLCTALTDRVMTGMDITISAIGMVLA